MDKVYLFTLHSNEQDLEIEAALLAVCPQEAASLWGGVYETLPDSDRNADGSGERRRFDHGVCVSSSNIQSLSLCGTVTFVPALFRKLTDFEVGMLGWDSGPTYDRVPGLVLHNECPPKEVRLIMRRTFVHVPSSVQHMFCQSTHGVYGGEGRIGAPGALRTRT